jgi:tRNA(Ile)-lysidine synthase
MVERLIKHIDSARLFTLNDSLLVGVSGGLDSVVLVHLLYNAGFSFALAHCNFKLRGEESDQDEAFVKALAARYDKPFFHTTFDTVKVAENEGVSIEMAARNLRYPWFEEIRRRHHYDWILVAHHLDDQIETFFLNLSRGTGISGLTGIKAVNGKVVRPLLFARRQEIETYAIEQNIDFREDSSNVLLDFQRNKIRHMVVPFMEELNPSFRQGMQETISHLHDAYLIFQQAVDLAAERAVMHKSGGEIEISLAELRLLDPLSTYLFEILKSFHFNGDVVDEMIKCIDGQSGKQFFSATHRAILDREVILVQKIKEVSQRRTYLEECCGRIESPVELSISIKKRDATLQLKTPSHLALIDKDKVRFPLIIRKWQPGDYFQPLGMKGVKKLSDFFVDEKFSLADKEKVWLLTNGEEIVWIIGVRLDDRYKITAETRNILEVILY